jgi:hypothetical protein
MQVFAFDTQIGQQPVIEFFEAADGPSVEHEVHEAFFEMPDHFGFLSGKPVRSARAERIAIVHFRKMRARQSRQPIRFGFACLLSVSRYCAMNPPRATLKTATSFSDLK